MSVLPIAFQSRLRGTIPRGVPCGVLCALFNRLHNRLLCALFNRLHNRLLCGLLCGLLAGCTDGDDKPLPTRVRLFDEATFVAALGPVDTSSRERMLSTTATTIVDDDATDVPADQTAKFEQPADLPVTHGARPGNVTVADWDGTPRLRIVSPGLYLRRLDLPAATSVLLQVDLQLRDNTSVKVFAAERGDVTSSAELRTSKLVRHMMEYELERTHFLRPETITEDGLVRFSAIIALAASTRSVVLGVFAEKGACAIWRIQAAELAPIASAVLGTAEVQHPPFRRSIDRGREQREALVIPKDGTLRLRTRIPEHAPELRFGLLGLEHGPATGYSVTVLATAGGERVSQTFALAPDTQLTRSFQDYSLDLASLAGEDATVEISAHAESEHAVGVAVGSPAIAPAGGVRDAGAGAAPLDLVIVSLDTVRADRLGLYGATRDPAPNLTELAKSSIVFDRAIAASSWTLPSHVTILTGQLPERHRVETEFTRILLGRAPLLAPELRKEGYQTFASTGGGFVQPHYGFAEGFERFGSEDPAFPPLEWAEAADPAQVPLAKRAIAERERLLAYLREDPHGPRFCFAHTYVAHNYQIPPSLLRELGVDEDGIQRMLPGVNLSELTDKVKRGDDKDAIQRAGQDMSVLYEAGVMLADRFLGDIMEALRESGRLERTVVVVLSDHGEEILDHGTFGHRHTLFDELLHVPLLMRIPGKAAARVTDVVSLADVAPTIRELLGISPPRQPLDGKSLVPLIGGTSREEPAFASTLREDGMYVRAMRGQDMKIIQVEHRKRETSEWSLYELKSDPKESRDMARFLPMEVEKLKKALTRHGATLKSTQGASQDATLSAELIRELKELGYLGGE